MTIRRNLLLLLLLSITAAGGLWLTIHLVQPTCPQAGRERGTLDRSGPRLRIDKPEIDFGVVIPGTELKAEFRLSNEGDTLLHLKNLRTSCGCAPPALDARQLLPGSATTLRVTFRVPMHAETFRHQILFDTDDPACPQASVWVHGTGRWPIQANPMQVDFPSIEEGATLSQEVELFSPGGEPFKVTGIAASSHRIVVEKGPAEPHVHRFRICVKGEMLGRFQEAVRFSTDVAARPFIIVPVSGEVLPIYHVAPRSLLLGTARPGAIAKVAVIVRVGPSDAPLNLRPPKFAEQDWQLVSWSAERVAAGVTRLHLEAKLPKTPGYHRACLRGAWRAASGRRRGPGNLPRGTGP